MKIERRGELLLSDFAAFRKKKRACQRNARLRAGLMWVGSSLFRRIRGYAPYKSGHRHQFVAHITVVKNQTSFSRLFFYVAFSLRRVGADDPDGLKYGRSAQIFFAQNSVLIAFY